MADGTALMGTGGLRALISGTAYWHRSASPDMYDYIYWCDGTQYEGTHPMMCGAGHDMLAIIYSANGYPAAFLKVEQTRTFTDLGNILDSNVCANHLPDSPNVNRQIDFGVRVSVGSDWTPTQETPPRVIATAEDPAVWSWQYSNLHMVSMHTGYGELYGEDYCGAVLDETIPFTMTVWGHFAQYISWTTDLYEVSTTAWGQYGLDHDPYGLPPKRVTEWYELIGGTVYIDVQFGNMTYGGSACIGTQLLLTAADFDSEEDFTSRFLNGFGKFFFWSSGDSVGINNGWPAAKRTACRAYLSKWYAGSAVATLTGTNDTVVFDTGYWTHESLGQPSESYGYTPYVEYVEPPDIVTYSGPCALMTGDWPGDEPVVAFDETAGTDYTLSAGDYTATGNPIDATIAYGGIWSIGVPEASPDTATCNKLLRYAKDETYGYQRFFRAWLDGGSWSYDNDHGGVINLDALNQPVFPSGTGETDGFDDSRIELRFPRAPAATNGVTFYTPAYQVIASFTDTSGWAVDPEGAATLSTSGGYLQAIVSTACTIRKDYTGSVSAAGAALMEVGFTNSGTSGITFGMAERTWTLPATTSNIELLSPNEGTGADIRQSLLAGAATWGWGVHDVGTVSFGFSPGTYSLHQLMLTRRSEEDGGFVGVYVFGPGAFVGSVADDPREGDTYTMWSAGTSPSEMWTRNYIAFVDGVVAAEGFGARHYTDEEGTWYHEAIKWSNGGAFWPATSFLTATLSDEPPLSSIWTDPEVCYLEPGYHSGYNNIAIDFRITGAEICRPFCPGIALDSGALPGTPGTHVLTIDHHYYTLEKYFGGRIAVRAMDTTPTGGAHRVTVTTHDDGGTAVATTNFYTDGNGWGLSPTLKQPIHGTNYYHIVKIDKPNDAGEYDYYAGSGCIDIPTPDTVDGTLAVRNANVSCITIRDDLA
jgi:hypothetical protein